MSSAQSEAGRYFPNLPVNVNYRALAEFRFVLRRFLIFSEDAAADVGLTSQQHQVLLAIKALSEGEAVSVRDIARQLLLRHHSIVELIDHLVKLDLVERVPDREDRRRIRIGITDLGEARLRELSAVHLRELHAIGPYLAASLNACRRTAAT